jgi:Mrp family chromosome partitioning ATPase
VLVNLSAALKSVEPNKTVGLLDTDVYGPSVPLMMNLHETPLLTRGTAISVFTFKRLRNLFLSVHKKKGKRNE